MNPHLSLLPSVATPDALPLSALRVRRPPVLHRVLMIYGDMNGPLLPVRIGLQRHQHPVAQHGPSILSAIRPPKSRDRNRMGATCDAITPPSRMVRAAMETTVIVNELFGVSPSIVTVGKSKGAPPTPLADQERAITVVSIAVSSDGASFHARSLAYVVQPGAAEVNPSPLMTGRAIRPLPVISIIPRQSAGNIIDLERTLVSTMQRASEPQLIADELDNIIPFFRQKLAADGLDAEEQAHLDRISHCSNRSVRFAEVFDLGTSLMRVGTNKRNTRRIHELFPELGPGAA